MGCRSSKVDVSEPVDIEGEFGDWLLQCGIRWTTVATLTFRNPCHNQVERLGARSVNAIWRATGRGAVSFICAEFGSVTGRYHLHGLYDCDLAGRSALRKFWRMAHGVVSLKTFEPGRGFSRYVSKYVTKETRGYGEWNFFSSYGDWDEIQERPEYAAHQYEIEADRSWAKFQKNLRQRIEFGKVWQEKEKKEGRYVGMAGGSPADDDWVDTRPMSGYTRYLSELGQLRS